MLLLFAGLAAAMLDMLAVAAGWHEVRLATKPLPALLFAVASFREPGRCLRFFGAGLLCAAIGDELLLQPAAGAFIGGMAAFALMQIAYIASFRRRLLERLRNLQAVVIAFVYFAIWSTLVLGVLLKYTGPLTVPVGAYSLLLIAMAISTLGFVDRLGWQRAWPLVSGGALFVASDTTLAFSKFTPLLHTPPKHVELLVMGSYYAAQALLTWGMTRDAAIHHAEA